MKVYKVIVNRNIVYDGVLRTVGDELFMADEDKVKYFEKNNYIKVVEVITDEVKKVKSEEDKPKKKSKRKKKKVKEGE